MPLTRAALALMRCPAYNLYSISVCQQL